MGGKKREPEVVYTPAPAPAVAVQRQIQQQYQGKKAFEQEEDVSDIETNSDLFIKKKRKGKRAVKSGATPMGGAIIPSDTGTSGLSVPY